MTNTMTVVGNLTGDPELRFTKSGVAVAALTVAYTPRKFDKASNDWKDGETLFMRGSVWREAAENAAESLRKGGRVIVTGQVVQRSFKTADGDNRTVIEMEIEELGPSLKYATASVTKRAKGDSPRSSGGGQVSSEPAASDPWGASETEPPF